MYLGYSIEFFINNSAYISNWITKASKVIDILKFEWEAKILIEIKIKLYQVILINLLL